MQNRIKYLDVAKFIGIFCVFLGHFGDAAGNAYQFVFNFHVPLFFFLSGCAENLSSETSWHKHILKNVKNILMPCYLFAILSVVLNCIVNNTYIGISRSLIDILKGCIRNQFLAGSLWFLTCLFVIRIVFFFLRKLLKSKILLLFSCIALYLFALLVITPAPNVAPRMPYNIDSACYYIVFYCLGYCSFKIICEFLSFDNAFKKTLGCIVGGVTFVFSAALFFGKNLFYYLGVSTAVSIISNLFTPIIVILLILIISKIIENVEIFGMIGKNVLFMCGSEYIVKLLFPICLQTIGLKVDLPNPISAYLYAFALLLLCQYFLVPVEKAIFKKLKLLK